MTNPGSGVTEGITSPSLLLGPVAILCATALMALQDAVVKALSPDLPLWQFFFLRSALVLPMLGLVMRRRGLTGLRMSLERWILLRSGLIVAMYVLFYAALPLLDLPVVSAVYYTGPIFIVLFSGLFLSERISAVQWVAVAVAFCGVLIVLRPGGETFSMAALLPLASALCYAVAMVATRGRLGVVNVLVLTFALNFVFAVVGLAGMALAAGLDRVETYPFLLTPWVTLDGRSAAGIVLLAAVSVAIHLLLARAYQLGPTALVAALDFSYLGFAAGWALVFFATVPSAPVVAGSALIGLAGVWSVLHRRSPHRHPSPTIE